MACVVDVGYVLLDALDDDAHGALTRLLARRDVDIVVVHELVDGLAVDVDLRIVEDECNRKVSLHSRIKIRNVRFIILMKLTSNC